jgi:hypothetical protein
LKESEVNLSRYRMSILDRYDQFRKAQLRDWMLYLVDREEVTTLAALRLRACQAFDFTGNPALRGLGLDQIGEVNQLVDQSLCDLYEQGWLEGDDQLVETDAGREHLSRQLNRFRGRRRR